MSRDDRAGEVFAALGDPTRRELVQRLAAQGEATATQLAGDLPMTRQAVSKHLAQLADARLVTPHRSGREVLYRLEPAALDAAAGWATSVGTQWDRRMDALRRHAERTARARSGRPHHGFSPPH